MPPAPARIASTPRQNSRTSWKPAVPPPPVPGAAVGIELADGLGDGGCSGLGSVAPGTAAPEAMELGAAMVGVVPPDVLAEVVAVGVLLAGTVGVAGPWPGENVGGVVGGELDEQADTDAVASTAKAAQPRTMPRKRRRPDKQDQRALQTRNGLFITVISGYAGRTP
jgi:hypothetical protein